MQKHDRSQKIRQEMTEFQKRLDGLTASGTPDQAYLINAYKIGLRIRSVLLKSMGSFEQNRP